MKTKGRKAQFTPKQVQRMRDMKAEGARVWEIAEVMGTSKSTVSSRLREKGTEIHEGK